MNYCAKNEMSRIHWSNVKFMQNTIASRPVQKQKTNVYLDGQKSPIIENYINIYGRVIDGRLSFWSRFLRASRNFISYWKLLVLFRLGLMQLFSSFSLSSRGVIKKGLKSLYANQAIANTHKQSPYTFNKKVFTQLIYWRMSLCWADHTNYCRMQRMWHILFTECSLLSLLLFFVLLKWPIRIHTRSIKVKMQSRRK